MTVHHIALLVRDLAAMERFYAGLLGLPVLRRWPGDAGERSVWLDLGAGAFLALERTSAAAAPGEQAGWHMVALRIAPGERATWAARLAAAGHPIHHRTPFTIYARDPEGNRVGLSHYPEAADADDHV